MRILVDADACPKPIKEIIFRASNRLELITLLVANQTMRIPDSPYIQLIFVDQGPDMADDEIVRLVTSDDLVITADIPLAHRVIEKGCIVLDHRGNVLSSNNIGNRLALRDLMDELRGGFVDIQTGPPPFSKKDAQEFAKNFDTYLTQNFKK